MNQNQIQSFITEYKVFKTSSKYKDRASQKAIIPVFREIILQVLKNETITNQNLTDLIQIFKFNCTELTFDNKLEALVIDKEVRTKLSKNANEVGERGYTNAGKNGVSGLTPRQLSTIRSFLLDAFNVKSSQEAVNLCRAFDEKKIPQVKKGIFSPWLFYINPEIFPIVNDRHLNFKKWLGLSDSYPDSIVEYHQLIEIIDEKDFGGLDSFAFHLNADGKLNLRREHYLNGSQIYKISHGLFIKDPEFIKAGVIDMLEKNNWVSISRNTGKGQADVFQNTLKIGDIVYLCYGGDKVRYVAKISSDVKLFDEEHAALLGDEDEEWLYREVEPLYYPVESNISDLKTERSGYMPSGHTTFRAIPKSDLDYVNSELFVPYFNLEVLDGEQDNSGADEADTIRSNPKATKLPLNTILYGPPGTGKTFHSISYAVAIVEGKAPDAVIQEANNDRASVKKRFDAYLKKGLVVFTTFHQSMSYEDFIEGIKPLPPEKDQPIKYDVLDGIFKSLCNKAESNWLSSQHSDISHFESVFEEFKEQWDANNAIKLSMRTPGKEFTITGFTNKSIYFRKASGGEGHTLSINTLRDIYYGNRDAWENGVGIYYPGIIEKLNSLTKTKDDKFEESKVNNYVIIIDEINRGNISQIFGELITLIEDDKRIGGAEELRIKLPYSKGELFAVPPNLYIIGTMNTADRSVEALDTALRRRFSFVPKMPEATTLSITIDGINLSKLLQTINSRLRILKDNDHTIGHAWFWHVKDIVGLKAIYANKILPLLQEYFYNDYEKLGLVLGNRFFTIREQVNPNVFATFSGGNGLANQYDQSWCFELKSADELTIEDFKSLELQVNKSMAHEDA